MVLIFFGLKWALYHSYKNTPIAVFPFASQSALWELGLGLVYVPLALENDPGIDKPASSIYCVAYDGVLSVRALMVLECFCCCY